MGGGGGCCYSNSQAKLQGLCDYNVCTVRQLVSASVGNKSKQSFHQSSLETLNKGYFSEHQRCFQGLNICVLVNNKGLFCLKKSSTNSCYFPKGSYLPFTETLLISKMPSVMRCEDKFQILSYFLRT